MAQRMYHGGGTQGAVGGYRRLPTEDDASSSSSSSSSSASSSSDSESDELSSDNHGNVVRHDRRTRVAVNKIMSLGSGDAQTQTEIPVYALEPGETMDTPPKSIVINIQSGEVHITAGPRVAYQDVVAAREPYITTTQGHMVDMNALRRATRFGKFTPSAIVFEDVNPKDVWLMFRFYKEITGHTKKDAVTNTMSEANLTMRKNPNHALFALGTVVGAGILLDAFDKAGGDTPEVSMTQRIIDTNVVFKKTIPYMVIPRLTRQDYVPPALPAVVVDGKVGVYPMTKNAARDLKNKVRGGSANFPTDLSQLPEGAINYMTMATYMNLTKLYAVNPNPKLVVFTNVCPSAVQGMIGFYERITNPPKKQHANERDTIYSAVKLMRGASMAQISKNWRILARLSGATPFEIILRRNL